MRPTVMEVDINKFSNNIKVIQNFIGDKKIMPVIKANGYGTCINKNLKILNQFDIVAVAIIDEAIELRNIGYQNEIFILNQPCINDIEDIIKYNTTIGISDELFLDNLMKADKEVKVHLEIETGMNRTGIKLDDLPNYINKIQSSSKITVEGIYTHLSSADFDKQYSEHQLYLFKKAVDIAKSSLNSIKYIHSCASNGILNCDDSVSNLVRPGIIMYGYEPYNNAKEKLKLEPICKLKSKITFLKNVDKGEAISYSQKFVTDREMKIATVPIGYADGIRRELTNKGYVVINGKKAKIIGAVCMDSIMVDVSYIDDIKIGTDVYIWDNEIRTLEEIANECGTINYEIMSMISSRVQRKFI